MERWDGVRQAMVLRALVREGQVDEAMVLLDQQVEKCLGSLVNLYPYMQAIADGLETPRAIKEAWGLWQSGSVIPTTLMSLVRAGFATRRVFRDPEGWRTFRYTLTPLGSEALAWYRKHDET